MKLGNLTPRQLIGIGLVPLSLALSGTGLSMLSVPPAPLACTREGPGKGTCTIARGRSTREVALADLRAARVEPAKGPKGMQEFVIYTAAGDRLVVSHGTDKAALEVELGAFGAFLQGVTGSTYAIGTPAPSRAGALALVAGGQFALAGAAFVFMKGAAPPPPPKPPGKPRKRKARRRDGAPGKRPPS